jgi:hypothetical protein
MKIYPLIIFFLNLSLVHAQPVIEQPWFWQAGVNYSFSEIVKNDPGSKINSSPHVAASLGVGYSARLLNDLYADVHMNYKGIGYTINTAYGTVNTREWLLFLSANVNKLVKLRGERFRLTFNAGGGIYYSYGYTAKTPLRYDRGDPYVEALVEREGTLPPFVQAGFGLFYKGNKRNSTLTLQYTMGFMPVFNMYLKSYSSEGIRTSQLQAKDTQLSLVLRCYLKKHGRYR